MSSKYPSDKHRLIDERLHKSKPTTTGEKKMKNEGIKAPPFVYKVVMVKNDTRYLAMPMQEKGLYPGRWKCGKCLRGVIIPLLYQWDAPKCKVCGTWVQDITFNDNWHPNIFTNKVFRYSHKPL